MSRLLKDAVLEKYLAGDAGPEATARVERALAQSPEDAQRLAELRADSAAFLLLHPPARAASRLSPAPPRRWQVWAPLVGAAVAAAVVLLLPPAEPDLATKGGLALTVHRRTADGSEALAPGAVLHPGDELRFELRAPSAGYAALFERDGSGTVSLLAPREGPLARALLPQVPLLPEAVRLDDSPGPESFIAVFSPRSFSVQAVEEALRQGRPLESLGLPVSSCTTRWPKQ